MSTSPDPTTNFNRPPRQQFPALPPEEIAIPNPPTPSPPPSANWLISALPVMGIGVLAVFYVWRAVAVPGSSALFALPLFILAIFAVGGTVAANRWRIRDHERGARRTLRDYIRALEKKRARLQAAHTAQRGILETIFPHAATGLDRALRRDSSLWERRPADEDFMVVRVGIGDVPTPVQVTTPDPDAASPEIERALLLADTYRVLRDAPVVFSLAGHFAAGVTGRRDLAVAALRAMVCHIALTHAPADLRLYIIAPRSSVDDWDWLAWLPHVRNDDGRDNLAFDAVAARFLLGGLSQIIDMRRENPTLSRLPHLLVIFDDPHLAESESVYTSLMRQGAEIGTSVLCLSASYSDVPGECSVVTEIYNNGAFRVSFAGTSTVMRGDTVDTLSVTDADHIARGLASVSVREAGTSGRIPRRVNFLDLYGLRRADDLPILLRRAWNRDIEDGVLPHPVPVGRESLTTNTYLLLDENHHGPHGVLAGTTGSGKSELLQTLVCALAIEHDPRLVNFLLIDFKGGSTFNEFAALPHTVGMVTNLDGSLVERALEALKAEIQWRQQFLKGMNARDITQYYRYSIPTPAALADGGITPLPHLFIIVDEFAQLAKEMPDFLYELVRTAQVGRSLGLHLILGTQSPMDVITDEMNANLQFRICLRVQNAEASRAMLRRPDAAYLPPGFAGRGYFMVGERGVYKQFQTAYAGGDYQGENATDEPALLELVTADGETVNLLAEVNPTRTVAPAANGGVPADADPYTTAAAVVASVCDYSQRAHLPDMPPLLLPPLNAPITLEDVLVLIDKGGWDGAVWRAPGTDERGHAVRLGSAPVGLVDDVTNREQYPLWVHLHSDQDGDRSGHLMVVGGPGTGKTTLLHTLALSLALLHPPHKLHLYILNFTGGQLNGLGHLPHAERVVHGTEGERVRRLFGRLLKTLDERQTARRHTLEPAIVLFVDQYEQLRDAYYDQHLPEFERLVHEGRSAGIYVVFTASTTSAVPDRTRSLVQQRVALRLASGSDYLNVVGQVNAEVNRQMPPGRGFVAGSPPLLCQISLPVMGAAVSVAADRSTQRLVNDLRQGAARLGQMQSPAPLTELPATILLETLPSSLCAGGLCTTLGQVDDDALSDFVLDWDDAGPHFIVTGPPASGKTNLLRAAVLAAASSYSPQQLRILLVDFSGRSLREVEPLKHVVARVTNALDMEAHLDPLERALRAGGGRVMVVIDDYEIAADVMSMNLDMLRVLRDHARLHDDGTLHMWVAGYLERIGDPLIKQLLLRRTGFALREREALHNLNVRVATLPNDAMPPGRAYFARHNAVQVVQTALVDDPAHLVRYVNEAIWPDAAPAAWPDDGRRLDAGVDDGERGGSLDIDTAGLIADLLGDDGE
jgi:DNA segregation ATPase FtsK/SpoIIIE, S-DNA-T family